MSAAISISNAEWEVMHLVWARAPVSAADLVAELGEKKGWQPRTTRTLIDRLVQKDALLAEHDGKRNLYRPGISREACVRQESRSFLERVFGGEPRSMLVHLVRESNLTKRDVRELRRILREKGE